MAETWSTILVYAGWLPVAVLVTVVGVAGYRLGHRAGLARHGETCWITRRPWREWEERGRWTHLGERDA